MTVVTSIKETLLSPSRVAAFLTVAVSGLAAAVGTSEKWDKQTILAVVAAALVAGYKWLDGRSKYETTELAIGGGGPRPKGK